MHASSGYGVEPPTQTFVHSSGNTSTAINNCSAGSLGWLTFTRILYLSVGARYVHRWQAVGGTAQRLVQPLDVGQAHLGGMEQVDLSSHVICTSRGQ